MKRYLFSAALLALAACGTPQEQCINSVTRDMQVVDKLIHETQGNIARGYAYTNVVETVPQFVDCTPEPTVNDPRPAPRKCLMDVPQTFSKPVAIDLAAEEAKLAGLQTKRAAQARAAEASIAACKDRYPQ